MDKTYGQPTPLSRDEIKDLVDRFAWAAHTVVKAGADGIVISISTNSKPFTWM
ncbi:hypothetical protein BJX64DRAFT_266057 [Aspergillus heterothallicus]